MGRYVDYIEEPQKEPQKLRAFSRDRAWAFVISVAVLSSVFILLAQSSFSTPQAEKKPELILNASSSAVVLLEPDKQGRNFARAVAIAGVSEQKTELLAEHTLGVNAPLSAVTRAQSAAKLNETTRISQSRSKIDQVSLFDGRLLIENAELSASARLRGEGENTKASGEFRFNPTTKIRFDDRVLTQVEANRKIAIKGIGTVIVNEQSLVANAPTGDKQTGPRYRLVGAIAHIRLTHDYGDYPAGTEIIIGRVDAGVRSGKVKAVKHEPAPQGGLRSPKAPANLAITNLPSVSNGSGANLPRKNTQIKAAPRSPVTAFASLQNYIFPVLGANNYTDSWGAARASTGVPHQGADIFAAEGTPIVAVSDGVLNRVGWNHFGGYRFWLFDHFGNSFYYAHLSAYAPIAQEGARVKAGDVIGFVGDTGDAKGTPFHLHFEIHPNNSGAVNPFSILNSWQQGKAVGVDLLNVAAPKRAASALVTYADISPNSGLTDNVLRRVKETAPRPIEDETKPQNTKETLTAALQGGGISRASEQ